MHVFVYLFVLLLLLLLLLLLSLLFMFKCTGLSEKRVRFPQGLRLVLYLYFRICYFLYC